MEGCEGDFDRLISGAHIGSDLSRFIQSRITADELQTQLTDNDPNTLVIDQSEVIIDLLSNSSSLTTSAEYLKLQNKAQVTVKEFDATFPIDSTRVNLADANCLLLSRGITNNLTTWNGTRFNHLASPSNINKFITADSSGDPVEFNVPVGRVPVARSSGFSTAEYKLASLDDVSLSDVNNSSNFTRAIGKDPSDNIVKELDYIDALAIQFINGLVNGSSHTSTSTMSFGTTSNYANTGTLRLYSYGITWMSGKQVRLAFNTSSGSGSAQPDLIIEEGGNGYNNTGALYTRYYNGSITHLKKSIFEDDIEVTKGSGDTFIINNTSGVANTTVNFIEFQNNGTNAGEIRWSSNSAVYYSTSSDYRLKENIQPIENASSILMSLKPCLYEWKSDGVKDCGFIAHEVEEVYPYAVGGEKDAVNEDGSIDPQGMDYGKMTPILTAALQEALVKIDSLEARIKELEDKE